MTETCIVRPELIEFDKTGNVFMSIVASNNGFRFTQTSTPTNTLIPEDVPNDTGNLANVLAGHVTITETLTTDRILTGNMEITSSGNVVGVKYLELGNNATVEANGGSISNLGNVIFENGTGKLHNLTTLTTTTAIIGTTLFSDNTVTSLSGDSKVNVSGTYFHPSGNVETTSIHGVNGVLIVGSVIFTPPGTQDPGGNTDHAGACTLDTIQANFVEPKVDQGSLILRARDAIELRAIGTGPLRLTNLAEPSGNTDATSKGFVANVEASLTAEIDSLKALIDALTSNIEGIHTTMNVINGNVNNNATDIAVLQSA